MLGNFDLFNIYISLDFPYGMTHLNTTQLNTVHLGLVWFGLIWVCSLELGNNEGNSKEITLIESKKLTKILEKHQKYWEMSHLFYHIKRSR